MLDCLTGLVGLTDMDCNCYDADKPADFVTLNASSTGHYLTDTDWGFPMPAATVASIDCGDPDNLFSVLEKARASAISSIWTELPLAMTMYHKEALRRFDGLVGKRKSSGFRTLTTSKAGQVWQVKGLGRTFKDVSFTVTAIWAGFNTTGTVALEVASNDPDFVAPGTVTLNTTAGVFTKNDLSSSPIVLPIWSRNAENGMCCDDCGLQYVFSYDLATGLKPMNNTYTCCNDNHAYKRYIEPSGFATDDLQSVIDSCSEKCNNQANGLIVEGYFSCDGLQWLCELDSLGGYQTTSLLARSIQAKANVYLANHTLKSGEINYWTVLHQEALYKLRSSSEKRFRENLAWIAKHMPGNASGCWECKPSPIGRGSF